MNDPGWLGTAAPVTLTRADWATIGGSLLQHAHALKTNAADVHPRRAASMLLFARRLTDLADDIGAQLKPESPAAATTDRTPPTRAP